MLGAVERKRQAWRSRTDQAQGIVKMRPGKGLQTYKVRVERSGPATYPRLAVPVGMCRPAQFLGLLGEGLRQTGSDPKARTSPVHCGEVGQVRRKILTLPEESHKVLRHIVALVEEVAHHYGFARVHVVAEDAGRTAHDRGFLVGFLHRVWSRIALMAATVTVTRVCCPIGHNILQNIKALEDY